MKQLTSFTLNVACLFPVLLSLDVWTPPAFLALAAVVLLVQRPDRWWALLAALGGAAFLAWWVFLSNLIWTSTGNPVERSTFLAVRAWALTSISACYALSARPADLLNELMQLTRLSPRVGYALFTALNTLPRLVEEQKQLTAVHRIRRGGKASPLIVQSVTLLARAIRSAERSALSLAGRGLEHPGPRTWFRPVDWTFRDTLQVTLGLALALGVFLAIILSGRFRFGFY